MTTHTHMHSAIHHMLYPSVYTHSHMLFTLRAQVAYECDMSGMWGNFRLLAPVYTSETWLLPEETVLVEHSILTAYLADHTMLVPTMLYRSNNAS